VDQKTKTELLIFLTPHVAMQPDELQPMSKAEQSGTKLIQGAVEEGSFQEQMRGMQLGAASQPAKSESTSNPTTDRTTTIIDSGGQHESGP
jgi:type II secretory pathway component GspD/PulD (secretin)